MKAEDDARIRCDGVEHIIVAHAQRVPAACGKLRLTQRKLLDELPVEGEREHPPCTDCVVVMRPAREVRPLLAVAGLGILDEIEPIVMDGHRGGRVPIAID